MSFHDCLTTAIANFLDYDSDTPPDAIAHVVTTAACLMAGDWD